MPQTPDRRPGPLEEEGAYFEPVAVLAAVPGEFRYLSAGRWSFFDGVGEYDPRTGGGGISEAQHKTLRQLIHFIDDGPAEGFASGAYKETLPVGPFPTESSAKAKKIVELTITRNANKTPATEVWEMYDIDGSTVLATVTDTISYSAVFETSRTRAIA